MQKSTVEEIRERFDADVERFSDLSAAQASAVDSSLCLDLLTEAASLTTPQPTEVLDLGCGAGNYTLRLLPKLASPPAVIRLVDLSRPMLDRAVLRIREAGFGGEIVDLQGDIREVDLGHPDTVLAAAVLHHLRTPEEWEAMFGRLYLAMSPRSGLWIYDMVDSEIPAVQQILQQRYAQYLTALKDEEYCRHVFDYIQKEDTPSPLSTQLNQLRRAGFSKVDGIHASSGFAAYGAGKGI